MKTIEEQYKDLLEELLYRGVSKSDRTGTGTKSVFGRQIRHNMADGFPLLTTKKMAWKSMVTELFWFLRGGTNIKYLVENGCHIWNGDAMKNYEKHNGEIDWGPFITKEEAFIDCILNKEGFAEKWGELGPIYGKQWRHWFQYDRSVNGIYVDQIKELINGLKKDPNGRRHIVSAWNVGDLQHMALPPCHYGFQCYLADGKLSLMWNQRSVDTFLGLPFNIASYATLLELIAIEIGAEPGELIGNLGDVHLYLNHLEQAKEQISREPYILPTIEFSDIEILKGDFQYKINDYLSHPSIKAPLSN